MKNVFLYVSIPVILFCLNCNLMGENVDVSKPEIILSKVVPVVNNEFELMVTMNNSTPIKGDAVLSIIYEGKEILREKISPLNGRVIFKWVPKETGFYTASFNFGTKSSLGKITRKFPVVYKELYFIIWPPLSMDEANKYQINYLTSYVILQVSPGSGYGEEEISHWKSKGSKSLSYVSGLLYPDREYHGKSENEIIDALVAKWSAPVKKGFEGIFIDEFGQYPTPESLRVVEIVRKALVRLRKENPDMLIFSANGGALLREEAISYKNSDSIALLETYGTVFTTYFGSHNIKKYIDNRIEVARNTDLIYERNRKHGALILLGLNGVDAFHEEPSIPELEDQVRYIKKTAPEMPGIGFYGAGVTKPYLIESGILKSAEEFCLKYYIKPVIVIRDIWFSDYSPTVGEELDILVNIHNLGGMEAKDVKIRWYAIESGEDKKKLISKEVTIEKIGCGYLTLEKKDKDKLYEYQEINENKYAVFDKHNTVFLERTTMKVSWKPEKKGYYTIIAEVKPSNNYTILDGVLRRDVCVQGETE